MNKVIFLFALLSIIGRVSAQDITINFQSKVDTVSIDSIRAINLSTNKTVKLLSGESLLLVKTSTGINQINSETETGYIYPNPTDGDATFCFSMDKMEEVGIRLYNANGQLLRQEKQNLSQGTHRFLLKFPMAGIYYLSMIKSDGITGFKAVYTGEKTQNSSILYAGSEKINSVFDENKLKSTVTDKTLDYTEGDVIQYSFFSGVNTTIVSDIPTVSKAIDVEFVSCIDNDGRSYKTVKIGDQWWMAENSSYLPTVHPLTSGSKTEPRYYVYDYHGTNVAEAKNSANYVTYGVLYNYPAAKAAFPLGWHLPTDAEWKELTTYLGGEDIAGRKMKETGTAHWLNPDISATNESGFSAIPGGQRYSTGKAFYSIGELGYWWSATVNGQNGIGGNVWNRLIWNKYSEVSRYSVASDDGFSVRYIKDTDTPVSNFYLTSNSIFKGQSVQFIDYSSNNPTSWLWDFGDGTTSTEQNPLKTFNTSGNYIVSLKASNGIGNNSKAITITVYESMNGTLVFEGHTYKTIIINGKEWMAENLAYLPAVFPSSNISNTELRYYVYDYQGTDVATAKNNANYTTYGVLYNWPAAIAACPPGWHLPTDAEWTDLAYYIGGEFWAGAQLKESGTAHWLSPNEGATNQTGFSGLPGGRTNSSSIFYDIGKTGYFWSATELNTTASKHRTLNYNSSLFQSRIFPKEIGMSVRYVKD